MIEEIQDRRAELRAASTTTPVGSPLASPSLLAVVFSLFSLLIFSPLLGSFFQEDDFAVLRSVSRGDPFGAWTHPGAHYFRPLVSLSMWVQYRLFGLNPLPYRLFNDLAHAGCATLCAQLASALLPGRKYLPWIAGFLFLLLPSHGEAVNWICARGEAVATFFGLLATLVFISYQRSGKFLSLLTTCAALFVGLMADECIVFVPVAFGLCTCLFGIKGRKLPSLTLAGTLILYFGVRKLLTGTVVLAMQDRVFGTKMGLITLAQICRTIMPAMPSADVRLMNITFLKTPLGAADMLAGLALVGFAFWAAKRSLRREDFFLLASVFGAGLLAIAGLYVHLPFPYAERFVYFPSAVTCIAVSVWISKGQLRTQKLLGALACLTAGFVLVIENRNWILAASLSERLVSSFNRDVVPQVADKVYIASEPSNVNGAEALGYQFGAVAELFTHRHVSVSMGVAQDVEKGGGRTEVRVVGGKLFVDSLDKNSVYDAGASGFVDQNPTPGELARAGLFQFGLKEVGVIRHSEPSFYWNGERFLSLP